jgi:hypothetical protein
MDDLGVEPDPTVKIQEPPKRIEITRKLAKQEIANRFIKYPNSRVSVVPFSGHPEIMFDGQDPSQLWPALETLDTPWSYTRPDGTVMRSDGGTDILEAIRAAVELCRQNPSPVGIHHIILVTDGEDYEADRTLVSWVPALQQSGVVLDFIHIGDTPINQGLKKACMDLGGDYVSVNTEKDFADKFISAVQRLLAPPASV